MPVRALVCDDDSPIRSMVRDLLENMGVEVLEATDGQQALSILLREPLDLVVIDFLMPKVDGLQVLRAIRLGGPKPDIPVVLMSAISKAQIFPRTTAIRPDHYVNKPFRPKKLAKLLSRIVEGIGTPGPGSLGP